jgi:cation diffusion facilitator CzcD-associated flavoprotein CzcO
MADPDRVSAPMSQRGVDDCFYSTGWVEAEGPSGVPLPGPHLLLSSSDVEVDLPEGWVGRTVPEAAALDGLLAERAWGCVAVLGDGWESAVASGLRVLRACAAVSPPARVVFLTTPGAVAEAGLWGLARTARAERPGLAVHCVEAPRGQLTRALVLSRCDGVEEEYRFTRHGVLEVPRLRRHTCGGGEFTARPDATYVVSGGGGAMRVVAEFLVARGARHLLVLTPPAGPGAAAPPPGVGDLRRTARVEYVACDVHEPRGAREGRDAMVAAGLPPVAGVVHAADEPARGTPADLARASGVGVDGAENLRHVFAPSDFLVLFTSAAATFRAEGQAAAVDALARSWSERGEPVLVIQWGVWSTAPHAAVERARRSGFGVIDDELGAMALGRLLAGPERGTVCVSPLDWDVLALGGPFVSRFETRRTPRSPTAAPEVRYDLDRETVDPGTDVSVPVDPTDLPVLVVGAGVGGIGFARALERRGVPTVVMEREDRIGGVWSALANTHSKLQIDSPSYGFDSVLPAAHGDRRWQSVFPGSDEVVRHARAVSEELAEPIRFGCDVVSVRKVREREYEVVYRQDGVTRTMPVSGVAALTGALHHPVIHRYRGEDHFTGHIGLGVANDTPPERFTGASVVVVGHGAFALENMRSALESGAGHVTIICRRRNLVVSTFCSWLVNSSQGATLLDDVVELMRPFYALCGVDIESLPSLSREADGSHILDQSTVPPASDVYFLAQALGKLTVVEDEIETVSARSVVTRGGREVAADVLVKCLGSDTDRSGQATMFGAGSRVEGLWVDGDPNLLAYNDRDQVPRKVGSLLCSSYAFFVQAYADAYLHYRDNPAGLAASLDRISADSSGRSPVERLIVELWDFIGPAKRNLAARTLALCPFDRFQREREAEWWAYAELLGDPAAGRDGLWRVMSPALSLLHRRDPAVPVERRARHDAFGPVSVFVSRRHRVLVLPGRGGNGRLARATLTRAGWTRREDLEFVIPDAPYPMPAVTDPERLELPGADRPADGEDHREWHAGLAELWDRYYGVPVDADSADEETVLDATLRYLGSIAAEHGPFIGVAGFGEGAAVLSAALHRQATGHDVGLAGVRFFIAMSAWRSPAHERAGLFDKDRPIEIPVLHTLGEKEPEVFLAAAPAFRRDFRTVLEHWHAGKHVVPSLTPGLDQKLNRLLHVASL